MTLVESSFDSHQEILSEKQTKLQGKNLLFCCHWVKKKLGLNQISVFLKPLILKETPFQTFSTQNYDAGHYLSYMKEGVEPSTRWRGIVENNWTKHHYNKVSNQ